MRDFLVIAGEWFDYRFANFALREQVECIEAREFLTKPQYRVAQTGETYRVINNWDENGLLFDNDGRENGWRKFSLTELVWIHCLRELRTFGFSMTALKKLKDSLFIFETLKGKEFNQLELAFFITEIIQKQDVILVVDKNGRGSICLVADYEKSQIAFPLPVSYVVINLNRLYGEITKQPKYSKKNTQNPDDVFSKIRDELRDGKRKRISLEVQDGKIIAMENTEKT